MTLSWRSADGGAFENPLIRKLSGFIDLTPEERDEVEGWSRHPAQFRSGHTLVHAGDPATATCLILSGWAVRYKDLRDGTRQIVGLLLPGDTCDLHGFALARTDHNISLLCDAEVALIESRALSQSLDRYPRLMKALWWASLVEEGITREWLVSLGRRNAVTRLAHLICELWARARRVGLVSGEEFMLPLTQSELGDVLGLTGVHINRSARVLREQGLVTLRSQQAVIPDIDALMRFAGFDPAYLQLEQRAPA